MRRAVIGRGILTDGQRRLYGILLGMVFLLLATSAFLFTTNPSGESLPVFYQIVLIVHVAFGLLALVPMIAFVLWHLRRAGRIARKWARFSGLGLALMGLVLAGSGLIILTEANSMEFRLVFRVHQIGALVLVGLFLAHRRLSRNAPTPRRIAMGFGALLAGYALLGAVLAVTRDEDPSRPPRGSVPAVDAARGSGDDPFLPLSPPALALEASPFFPALVTTTSGAWAPLEALTAGETGDRIGAEGCAKCHPDVAEQWASSAHRFSSMSNPFYRVAVDDLRAAHGRERSRWCGGCHDPALLLPGEMLVDIDSESVAARAGLTCLACHAIERIHNLAGNAGYELRDDPEVPYLFEGSGEGAGAFLFERLVRSKPDVHRRRMKKPVFSRSEYCSTCHKVSLDAVINDYRFVRGQDEYDDWHDSGVSLNNPRTYYLPGKARTCQGGHMPREPAPLGDASARNGTVMSHRFLGANTALPAVRGDADMLRRTEDFLRSEVLRVDLAAIVREDGSRVLLPERGGFALTPGERVEVHLVVRNLGVGHRFPGGTNDSNEAWIELTAWDGDSGKVLVRSGEIGPDGEVDPGAHFFRAVFIDKKGRRANARNPQDFRTLVYARTIGPGTADIVRYSLVAPDRDAPFHLNIGAALNWRKFNRDYTLHVFDRLETEAPDLPVTRIADTEVSVPVGGSGARRETGAESDWVRVNDYGIGLFLQGETRAAAEVFAEVSRLAPERSDGPLNRARVALADGDVTGALANLSEAERRDPTDRRLAFFLGKALRAAGRYEEAERALQMSLVSFPRDRGTLRELGTLRFLSGDFSGSLEHFLSVLTIDPEDVDAHYHRMKCYEGLGLKHEAAEARKAYLKYKVDDNAAKLARSYLLANPDMNREAQPVHVHE